MTSYSSQLEHLINDLGGCGLMQKLLCAIILTSSTVIYWSTLAMAFIGYDPGFTCHTLNVKLSSLSALNLSNLSVNRLCSIGPNAMCSSYIFPQDLNTVVSEWNLVCDRRWIVSFITSIQMAGFLVGSITAGQMADSTGRKTTMIAGISTVMLFNFAGLFAQSWEAYSSVRFFIGIGAGLFSTVQYTHMIEFVPSLWRPLVVCIPAGPVVAMLFALVAWWLHDWKRIHLLKALLGLFFLIIQCFVPESVRWLVSKLKLERAEREIKFVAKVNGVHKPDLKNIFETAVQEINTTSNRNAVYTVATLWTSKELRNVTLPLALLWFSVNTAWYGMTLGMESISVDIYLTIFLINLVDLPARSLTGPLINRFGRRKYCYVTAGMSSILSCVSGILQYFDKLSHNSESLTMATLVISLLAKMTVTAADICLIIYTTELYPTVVRTIGYSFQATVGRLGAVAVPFLIHLDGLYPGTMYFTCGVLIFLSAGCIMRLKETKNMVLQDIICLDSSEGHIR
ncbi:solute carrier family 22 member 4-like [Mercenaria mercenaria]|uniref:solute carrier family 22 member 4-like n=1 Tax=Mercenaria mercenaria TaxID=6596 RepID=UPI00234F728C|nr:solute carrier family 22 member 4-like [Mercenaria mercenaria]